ncbi:hypothetical protein ADL00_02705, partial [Streptomyces sp. AS58]|uniref:hypothetical protein n=1 Tax=Streptomyces sp. AS58 TaxID=1519489 RepID=UPI0006C12926
MSRLWVLRAGCAARSTSGPVLGDPGTRSDVSMASAKAAAVRQHAVIASSRRATGTMSAEESLDDVFDDLFGELAA